MCNRKQETMLSATQYCPVLAIITHLDQWFLTNFAPKDIWQFLDTFLVVITGGA